MSFVGPRAYRPDELDLYIKGNPELGIEGHPDNVALLDKIYTVKPGITGRWQVSGRSNVTFDERVEMDANYADNWSVLEDIKIILETPSAVLKREGAA